ncbi:hypothetical protein ACFYYY_26005 [Streptomyces sp. NPDC001834]|uniref:hypothetical protein n=1 Tax=Streptomyces sp. NPDC001834 TaxID=3364616 RepID=UPI003677EAC6
MRSTTAARTAGRGRGTDGERRSPGAVGQVLRDAGGDVPPRTFGVPERFLAHGTRAEVPTDVGRTGPERRRDQRRNGHRGGGRTDQEGTE